MILFSVASIGNWQGTNRLTLWNITRMSAHIHEWRSRQYCNIKSISVSLIEFPWTERMHTYMQELKTRIICSLWFLVGNQLCYFYMTWYWNNEIISFDIYISSLTQINYFLERFVNFIKETSVACFHAARLYWPVLRLENMGAKLCIS